ncbi:potassium transporter Kup, partial [Rhizobium leguminosarum]
MTETKLRSADPELEHLTRQGWPSLVLAALGVVYGDIGTSPLYAFREALHATGGSGADYDNVLGILSLIVWALTIVVTLKYVTFVLKADNRGEGGTLSLMT